MKSFSQLTKEELCKTDNSRECCYRAEHLGLLLFGATITRKTIKFVTENTDVHLNYINLAEKNGLNQEIDKSTEKNSRIISQNNDRVLIENFLYDLRLIDSETGVIRYRIDEEIIKNECCRRSLIKGAFLAGGTVIDPQKNYNLELVTPYMGLSQDMQRELIKAGFDFKVINRKSKYVLYMKNSDNIADFLSYMGAYRAQMELLNIKIEKEIRNDFNRAANSETANLFKTINASVEQVHAIEKVNKNIGLDNLPEDLREIAVLRLENKEMSLAELGKMVNPPLTKSGVNHRLKKLIEMAK